MSAAIVEVTGREILDSRGRPTVEASVRLRDGTCTFASVPAGASKGRHEAVELRDGEQHRYRGLGVRKAVENINAVIGPAVRGLDATAQEALDDVLLELDGTPSKSRLGANALLAVSLAVARAAAASLGVPLWRHLGGPGANTLPLPMVNIISGGLHAQGNVDFQDFLVMPVGASSFGHALEMTAEVYDATRDVLVDKGSSTLKADEGGFGPLLQRNEAALDLLLDALERAGFEPGVDVAFAVDVAASHFYDAGTNRYEMRAERTSYESKQMAEMIASLVERYPIVSVEDGLSEDDWSGWEYLTSLVGGRVQLIGDDLFATNLERLERGIATGAANAVLVKMNQIGTLTETFAVVRRARESGFNTIVSARSGDTEDPALADLAVATNAGQIKIGSLAQSERLAKYNQLLRIEQALGDASVFPGMNSLTSSP